MILRASSRTPRHLTWIVVLALTTLGTSLQAGDITGIVAFGDSLSDTGNTYLAINYPPSPPYYPGHYSNGPIWLEYLAARLGVAAPTPSLAGGTDNAWGGAQTGDGLSFRGTPNIGPQISTYLTHLGAVHTISSTQLVTIWGGANDFLNAHVTDPSIPVANLVSEITTLAKAGGKQFLVPNLSLLGDLPATNTSSASGALNFLTMQFDSLLHTKLDQLQQQLGVAIHQVDVNSTFQSILASPGAYGLTNVTDSSLPNNTSGQGYLFWDTVHPTTVVQELIGDAAFATVPEPSALTLVLIAAPVVLAWRRRAAFTSPGPRFRDGSGRA